MSSVNSISFYQRFVKDINSGKKTITIRDIKANNYTVGQSVQALTHENNQAFAQLKIINIQPILFEDINDKHAKQENMRLLELKDVIREIYPDVFELYVLEFRLID